MVDPEIIEKTYMNKKKALFKSLFNKEADENLELFLQYSLEETNRELKHELNKFNDNFQELKDSGFFDR